MVDLKGTYEPLQKKYGLPSYDLLNAEFELLYIANVVQIDYPLRFIRRKMSDRFGLLCSMLQAFLQPNPGSFINLRESSFFSADEKKQMQDLIRQLMEWERRSLHLDLRLQEKEDVSYIKDASASWASLKPHLDALFSKLPLSWKTAEEEHSPEDKNHYFG